MYLANTKVRVRIQRQQEALETLSTGHAFRIGWDVWVLEVPHLGQGFRMDAQALNFSKGSFPSLLVMMHLLVEVVENSVKEKVQSVSCISMLSQHIIN